MNLIPDINELWQGIGGTFDSFTSILAEMIDNSISNLLSYKTNNKSIYITIENFNTDTVSVKIIDSGSGILNLESALKLGAKNMQVTSMNEHGFGIKHALASANPQNDSWSILTKKVDKTYYKVSSPYTYDLQEEIIDSTITPFPSPFTTGTIIEFKCSKSLFFTLRKGNSGNALESKCLGYLCDDLSFLYSNFLLDSSINITVSSSDFGFHLNVAPLVPNYVGFYNPKKGVQILDLGNGEVKIHYVFGEIADSTSNKYYKKNQTNSGCEIRLNGRLLDYNIFTPIWGREVDPHYNHFLVQINIISNDPSRLPSTKTTKNGIRLGDEKLIILYNWIRNILPIPPKESSDALSEKMLVTDLVEIKKTAFKYLPTHNVTPELEVFKNIGCPVNVDLYVFDSSSILLYECKKGRGEPRNLYQLLMYWDGAVSDGLLPTKGILIAHSWSDGLQRLLDSINQRTDANGTNYNLAISTWESEGINRPI